MSPRPSSGREFTVGPDDDGIRLDRWCKRHLPETSFTTVAKWARTGQIRVDGARASPGDRVLAGQQLRLPPAEPTRAPTRRARERTPLTPDQVEFAQGLVIHRDAQALVLNKPPGLATQGGTKTTEHVDALLDAFAEGGIREHQPGVRHVEVALGADDRELTRGGRVVVEARHDRGCGLDGGHGDWPPYTQPWGLGRPAM